MKLPLDITRCTNSDCKESLSCKRRVSIIDDAFVIKKTLDVLKEII